MLIEISLLVELVELVDRLPQPPQPAKRGHGRPYRYSDRLFLKALIVMIVKHLYRVKELREVLEQPTPEMLRLRQCFLVNGHYPSRRTWERRLNGLPVELPDQIALLGDLLLETIQPFAESGQAVAVDSTTLPAKGPVWHQSDRAAGRVPHSSIDTEAHWTKSGWLGWVYGWKLHIAATVAGVWIPLGMRLTPANTPDDLAAYPIIKDLPKQIGYVLGDSHYHRDRVELACQQTNRTLIASSSKRKPRNDEGVEVRKFFHQLRTHTIENDNSQFKGIFDAHRPVPTKGWKRTSLWALGCIFVYQLLLWYRYESQQSLRVGLKAALKAG